MRKAVQPIVQYPVKATNHPEPFLAPGIPLSKMLTMDVREELPVQAARNGDAGAWNVLFQRYRLPLYVYAFELLRNRQDALDIVQETFLNAIRYLSTLRDENKLGSWLFSIAHQKCLQHSRRSSRANAIFFDSAEAQVAEIPDGTEQPQEWLIRKEHHEQFVTMLAQLAPSQRSVLLLHFIEDFSLEEIAAITGIPVGTVKSRLFYAKQALRKLIEDTDYEEFTA